MWTISSVTSPKGKLTLTECVGRKNFSWNHTVLICAYLRDLLFKWVCTCYLTEFLRVDPSVISIIQDITWTVKLQASLMCLLMAYFYSPLKSDKLSSHQNIILSTRGAGIQSEATNPSATTSELCCIQVYYYPLIMKINTCNLLSVWQEINFNTSQSTMIQVLLLSSNMHWKLLD